MDKDYTFEKHTATYIKIPSTKSLTLTMIPRKQCIIAEITVTPNRLVNEDVIDQDMANFATPRDTKPGRFYSVPRVHKCRVPGRPISSC